MKTNLNELTPEMILVSTTDSAPGSKTDDVFSSDGWVAETRTPEIVLTLRDIDDSPKVYQVVMTVTNVKKIDAVLNDDDGQFVKSVTVRSLCKCFEGIKSDHVPIIYRF